VLASPAARRPSRPAAARFVALALASGLALAGCVAPKEQVTPAETTPTEAPPVEPGQDLDAFYGQDITWETCGRFECATVQAPLDWDDPSAGSIDLALKRSQASGPAEERVGSLLINPGGPGGSGVEFLEYAVTASFSRALVSAFDVVGFDPRGVGESSAVRCGDDETVDQFLTADAWVESQADLDAERERTREFGEMCRAATGPLIGYVDTVSSARDMDLLRALLGDDELYYAGFSYGTFLGATYAELYPENVGRLLLDGAIDPSITIEELALGQAVGFEDALRAYVEHCQAARGCPLSGDVEQGLEEISRLVERVESRPLRAGDGQTLNATMLFYGIVVTLYDEASWTYLTAALDEALTQNTGAFFLELANFYLDRTADGTYQSNQMIAFGAINCLDYPAEALTFEELETFADEVEAAAPTFGRSFVMGAGCEAWPIESRGERGEITAEGAAPILVVGTTGDPATPYEWSVALAEQLESGVLMTYEGEGHTAYGRGNQCVQDVVDAYLVDGVVPEDGVVC
jgi:pimeloyl-ACP methyl ester carboxylesterase